MKAAYCNLKANAKRRGKEFSLTFEQFRDFAIKTDYHQKKGVEKESFHIDRIDEEKGYSIDNIQVLTNSQNVKKYVKYIHPQQFRVMRNNNEPYKAEGVPF